MDLENAIEARNNDGRKLDIYKGEASGDEIKQANWSDPSFSVGSDFIKLKEETLKELEDKTQEVTGQNLQQLMQDKYADYRKVDIHARVADMQSFVDTLPDEQKKNLLPLRDVWGRYGEKANKIMANQADVASRTYGFSNNAMAWLYSTARDMVTPEGLAIAAITAPLGGPVTSNIAKSLGREFLIGAGAQAVQEPFLIPERQKLGVEQSSIGNIVDAGVANAGMAGLFRGAAHIMRKGGGYISRNWRDAPNLTPDDFEAAANLAEREQWLDRELQDPIKGRQDLNNAQKSFNDFSSAATINPEKGISTTFNGLQSILRPDGTKLEARYAVFDRGDLITSHTIEGMLNPAFPAELQPRDRSQITSHSQVLDIASNLQPERLGPSPIPQEGAPIIGPDGIVESGNGRVLALEQVYNQNPEKAKTYVDYIKSLGFENIDEMKQPILVRVREQELPLAERAAFANESNIATTGSLSSSERAFMDAKRLNNKIMDLWEGGEASIGRNQPFVREFATNILAPQEQKNFLDSAGLLSQEGMSRIEAAMVAKAYGDKEIVRQLTESTSKTSKNILAGLVDASSFVAKVEAGIASNAIDKNLSMSSLISKAFSFVEKSRREGKDLNILLNQADLERGATPEEVRAAVGLFFKNDDYGSIAKSDVISARIANASMQILDHKPGGLFEDDFNLPATLRAAKVSTENLSSLELTKKMSEAAKRKEPDQNIAPDKTINETTTPQNAAENAPKAKVELPKKDPVIERIKSLADEVDENHKFEVEAEEGNKTITAKELLNEIEAEKRANSEFADCNDRSGSIMESNG